MKAVAYYRVSTDKQGRSGLGLEAQKETVRRFLGDDYPPIREFKEVESGKRGDRPQLHAALAYAKLHKVALVVAKLDRLTRKTAFLEAVRSSGVKIVFCDIPETQGAMGEAFVGIMGVVAQLEAGLISERTKAALQAAKARGKVLGGFRGVKVDPALGTEALQQKARERAAAVASTIEEIRAAGATSLHAIAKELNSRGIPTPRGKVWYAMSVRNALAQIQAA